MKINIVFVEPEIPQNTGNVARTCACIGASLHLVKPLGFSVDEKRVRRSGMDYWNSVDVHYYENFDEFLEVHRNDKLYFFSKKASKIYTEVEYPSDSYLVFGKESTGLPEDFLMKHFDSTLRIPMKEDRRSLNLSNAAAIAAYEVLRQSGFENLEKDSGIIKNMINKSKE